MGVPAFFRWLSRKYPSVIVFCNEEKPKVVDSVTVPVDSSQPNPNGVEFDNLYLDMNGIIHPCTHPEDKPAPRDEDEMMVAIFQCIDRLFSIVRPRKLLYMAIDGVAPRAKMNQQRSRRFRASKETTEKIQELSNRRQELLAKGAHLPPEKPKESHFDSNCITPGTPFMARLSACLHYYIHERLTNDPGWRNIKVILSDANVPGEGEHKIMDYIRKQRAQPDHDPNTQHVLCGADADLIMLGLATHEPNFTIIREEFRPNKPRPCDLCLQIGHEMKDCVGCPKPIGGGEVEVPTFGEEIPFIFVRLSVLREYLERELVMPGLPFKYDFERAVDDWVFMCFFVGNDFLPHLPSLEIREGAIDRLVSLYKNCVYKTGGFVTDSGNVNLSRVQLILSELGKVEDEIFKKRQQTEQMFKQREKNRKRMAAERDGKPAWTPRGQFAPSPVGSNPSPIAGPRQEAYQGRMQGMHTDASTNQFHGKRKERDDDEEEEETHDEVRLWEDGFKDRYYESKFDVAKDNIDFRILVGHEYVRGLCWVLRYYYQGCASWKWYFPYHYAPFASDFVNVGDLSTEFEKGTKPFQPLQQLMGVFPAASGSHVPKPWSKLMSDPFSPIIDFYPIDFKIDLNGKKFAWQGVALLPFVDEGRLFKALAPYYDDLTPAEKKRNIRGDDRLYIGPGNSGFSFLKTLYEQNGDWDAEADLCMDKIRGTVLLTSECVSEGGQLLSPVRGQPTLYHNQIVCVRFRDPAYAIGFIFPAKRLAGAKEPDRVLKPGDLSHEQNRNWRPQIGMVRSNQRAGLGQAGHRMVDHYNQSNNAHNRSLSEGQLFNAVPPPSLMAPFYQGPRTMPAPYHPGMQPPNRNNQGQHDRSSSWTGYSSQGNRSNSSYGYQTREYSSSQGRSYNQRSSNYNQGDQHHRNHHYQRSSHGDDRNRSSGGHRHNEHSDNRQNHNYNARGYNTGGYRRT